jgi:hypothetical protein
MHGLLYRVAAENSGRRGAAADAVRELRTPSPWSSPTASSNATAGWAEVSHAPRSASPVRRASCSGSIVRQQALQFCLGVGKVIFNRQPVTFVAAGCASDLVPVRSSLAEA